MPNLRRLDMTSTGDGWLQVRSVNPYSGGLDVSFELKFVARNGSYDWNVPNFFLGADANLDTGYRIEFFDGASQLIKTDTGSVADNWSTGITLGGPVALVRVVADGTSIRLYIDGTQQWSYATSDATSGYIGLIAYAVNAEWDNFTGTYVDDFESVPLGVKSQGTTLGQFLNLNGAGTVTIEETGNKSMTASATALAMTRNSANLLLARKLAANRSTYATSLKNSGFRLARKIIANVRSYTMTRRTANTLAGRRSVSLTGSYAASGVAANLKSSRSMLATIASVSAAAAGANLLVGRCAFVDAGSVSLAGYDATLLRALRLAADGQAWAIAPSAANLLAGRKVAASVAVIAMTRMNAQLKAGRRLAGTKATATVTARTAQTLKGYRMTAQNTAHTIVDKATGLRVARSMPTLSRNLAVAVYNAGLITLDVEMLLANTTAFSLGTTVAFLKAGRRLSTNAGAFGIAARDAVLGKTGEAPPQPVAGSSAWVLGRKDRR